MFLPVNQKTIPPLDAGGVAGGEKYLCNGIFYKLVLGSALYSSYELAAKVAAHELNGLNAYQYIHSSDLTTGLMSVIDIYGYRIIAVPKLPINNSTLVYGSADAAKTVKLSNQRVNALMRNVAEKLNIKGHAV